MRTCGRCGKGARGLADIDGVPYCHEGDDPTCYQQATWTVHLSPAQSEVVDRLLANAPVVKR